MCIKNANINDHSIRSLRDGNCLFHLNYTHAASNGLRNDKGTERERTNTLMYAGLTFEGTSRMSRCAQAQAPLVNDNPRTSHRFHRKQKSIRTFLNLLTLLHPDRMSISEKCLHRKYHRLMSTV